MGKDLGELAVCAHSDLLRSLCKQRWAQIHHDVFTIIIKKILCGKMYLNTKTVF